MKKILLILIAFLVLSFSQAITVERSMVPAIDFGDTLTVSFTINPDGATSFEFTDAVPSEWQFINWDVQGIDKESVKFSQSSTMLSDDSKEIYKWKFENAAGLITLNYDITVKSAGEEKLTALWIVGDGIDSKDSELVIRSTGNVCGNSICETAYNENMINCPSDCIFKMNVYFWLALLFIATIISISGLYYREYKKIEPLQRAKPRGPVQVIQFELKEKSKEEAPAYKELEEKRPTKIVREKPRKKTVKPIRTAKKPLKKGKIKKTKQKTSKKSAKKPSKNKSEKLYKETLSRLSKIKKELKA